MLNYRKVDRKRQMEREKKNMNKVNFNVDKKLFKCLTILQAQLSEGL